MSNHLQVVPSVGDSQTSLGDAQRSLAMSAEMVRCLLPEFDQVSLTVLDGTGNLSSCAQAGEVATDLDRLQYDLGEGPCIESLRGADLIVVPHIEQEERWRHYVPSATGLGLRSQVATPMFWRERAPLGTLNLYSTTRADIAPTAPLIAKAVAAQAAIALANLQEIEDLHRALDTRTTVGVAIGILMEQYQLTQQAAFEALRRRSSHANVKLRDIAGDMVSERNAAGLELPPAAHC